MISRNIIFFYIIVSFLLFYCLSGTSSADGTPPELSYGDTCRVCHADRAGVGNRHHLLMLENGMECMSCHGLTTNPETGQLFPSAVDNICFLECHAPMLYRTNGAGSFFGRVTPEIAWENGWDISVSAATKTADFHHQNYGTEYTAAGLCFQCHYFPPGGGETEPVADSAGMAQDVDNIWIVIANDQLVYDINPGETLHIDASGTYATAFSAIRWSINNQEIPSAAGSLNFDYLFRWGYSGDTYVVKLEVWDIKGRYAKQNIAVNIR